MADQIHLKNFNSRPHGGRREKSVNFPVWLISTHALTEGDVFVAFFRQLRDIFQLTPSRRATILSRIVERKWKDFNSRPHGGRLQCNRIFFSHGKISTHALTEGDAAGFSTSYPCFSFQLTPSRRATSGRDFADHNADISTHALTEGDRHGPFFLTHQEISTHALTEGDFHAMLLTL